MSKQDLQSGNESTDSTQFGLKGGDKASIVSGDPRSMTLEGSSNRIPGASK